jgi:DNA gyrase subunit B
VVIAAGADTAIDQDALRELLRSASQYKRLLARMALRRLDERVVDAAVWGGAPRESDLANADALTDTIGPALAVRIGIDDSAGESLSWSTEPDPEHGGHRLIVATRRAGVEYRTILDTEFIRSADFQRPLELAEAMTAGGQVPFTVTRGGGDPETIDSHVALLERLLELGEKGLSIQRYKGLGEMNPDQLADTTMDAQLRTLLQVRAPDDVEADDAFTTLMGDEVEPRRQFIERNALDVQNLDI